MLKWLKDIFDDSSEAKAIDVLIEWNEELKLECKELKQLLYRKSGIIEDYSVPSVITQKPVQRVETWRTARSKLEEKWANKEKEAIAKGELSE